MQISEQIRRLQSSYEDGALGKLPFAWRMVARSTELSVERITRVGVERHRRRSMFTGHGLRCPGVIQGQS